VKIQGAWPWYRFVAWLFRYGIFGTLGGVTVRHADRVPMEGPVIVAPVHVSHFDPPLMGATFPRVLRTMAKKELFFPPLGWLIRSIGVYPVNRGEADSSAIRTTLAVLEAGESALLFPEGTRGDGVTLGPIQPGIALFARKTGAKIVPVGLAGTAAILPKGKKFPRRSKCTVVFGEPFSYADLVAELGEKEAKKQFSDILAQRLAAACAEAGFPVALPPKQEKSLPSGPDQNRAE